MEKVVLVNSEDESIGTMEKMEAHQKGELHRAFSIFVFNDKDELLLQQRATEKYHSGGLWTNTCCSHPRPGENTLDAAHRRLVEEMGFDTPLDLKFSFIYKAELDHALTEHELDHVLIGRFNDTPVINPEEVKDWKFVHLDQIQADIHVNPQHYTEWFKIVFDRVKNELLK